MAEAALDWPGMLHTPGSWGRVGCRVRRTCVHSDSGGSMKPATVGW